MPLAQHMQERKECGGVRGKVLFIPSLHFSYNPINPKIYVENYLSGMKFY